MGDPLREALDGATTSGRWEARGTRGHWTVTPVDNPSWIVADVQDGGERDALFIATFDPDTVSYLLDENERLGVLLDLIDSRTGWTMLGRIEKRLNALTYALNRASKLTKARRWLRRKLHPDAEPLYSEAMTNMAGAVAEAAVHAVVEGRFAANATEENERLRAENQTLRTALVAMIEDHPFVLSGDDAAMVAAWFINHATRALATSKQEGPDDV